MVVLYGLKFSVVWCLTAYCAWRVSEPFDRVGKHIWSLHLTLVCVLAMENRREVEVGMGADLGCFNPVFLCCYDPQSWTFGDKHQAWKATVLISGFSLSQGFQTDEVSGDAMVAGHYYAYCQRSLTSSDSCCCSNCSSVQFLFFSVLGLSFLFSPFAKLLSDLKSG